MFRGAALGKCGSPRVRSDLAMAICRAEARRAPFRPVMTLLLVARGAALLPNLLYLLRVAVHLQAV